MESPLVTIIIPSYNYAQYIGAALESALAQDYRNLEIIVIDDRSTDDTAAVVEPYLRDPRVSLIRNERNLGVGKNLNKGLKAARGAYIGFLSADDKLMPGFVSSVMDYLGANPRVDIVYGDIMLASGDESDRAVRSAIIPAAYIGGANDFAHILTMGCLMPFTTLLVRRDIYERYGDFDENVTGSDLDLIMRWAAAGIVFAYVPRVMAMFRVHDTQASAPQRFVSTGRDLVETIMLTRRYLTAEREPLIRGFEREVRDWIIFKHRAALEHGLDPSSDTQAAYEALIRDLHDIQARNAALPFEPSVTVVLEGAGRVADLERSLLSLLDQSFSRWEAILALPPAQRASPEVRALCERLGGERVRILEPGEQCPKGGERNLALRVAYGNCFVFLTPGNTFPPDHLQSVTDRFRSSPERVLLTDCRAVDAATGAPIAGTDCAPTDDPLLLLTYPLHTFDTIAIRREAIDAYGDFVPRLGTLMDWHFLLRWFCMREPTARVASSVNVDVRIFCASYKRPIAEIRAEIDAVYTTFRVPDPGVQARRALFLQSLPTAVGELGDNAQGFEHLWRLVHGMSDVAVPM